MNRFFRYYGQWQGVRGDLLGLPTWARAMLMLLAVPGILLLALSILGVLASLAALLLLTVPAYQLLRALTVPRQNAGLTRHSGAEDDRFVDVEIIDPPRQ